jgi:hypothetical protein
MAVLNTATAVRLGTAPVQAVYLGGTKVWPPAAGASGYLGSDGVYTAAGGTSFSITVPDGVQVGDLCILVVGRDAATPFTVDSPGLTTMSPGVAAGSSYMVALSGPVAGATVDYTVSASANHSAAAHFFRGVAVGTVGVAGVRPTGGTSLTVPGVTGSGGTWALVADRSQAATVEEQTETITVSWGSVAGYYGGNPALNAGGGITAHWLVDGGAGQAGALDVEFADWSPSAWGVCLTLVGA